MIKDLRLKIFIDIINYIIIIFEGGGCEGSYFQKIVSAQQKLLKKSPTAENHKIKVPTRKISHSPKPRFPLKKKMVCAGLENHEEP